MERLSNDVFDRYYKSWHGIDAAYDKIAARCGVTSNIMNILTMLYKHRTPMSQNELSRELYLSKQTVTSVVDSLEKRGLVTRTISEGDRRSREVALNESGRTAGRRIGREMRRVELAAFELLSEEEQRALVNIQEKLWHGFYQVLGEE